MNNVYGISLSLSSFEESLWFDHDQKGYRPNGCGVKLDIVCGKMIRPIPCIHKLNYWKSLFGEDPTFTNWNPWRGGKYLCILRIPFVVGPFISIALGPFGVYIGFKTFGAAEEIHNIPERYGKWMRPEEFGSEENENRYLQLSVTVRSTRWK